jgi:hypothetical protein
MLVDSQATSHYVLLLGIPERYQREELISFLGDVVSLDSFKLLRHFDTATQRHTRLGIVQVHSGDDILRTVSRYLGDQDGSMENLVLKGDLRLVEDIVRRHTNLRVSYGAAHGEAARSILASALGGCGELSEAGTEYEEGSVVCSYRVTSAFSMSKICTGQTFSAQGVLFHVQFEEETLSDCEFSELLLRAQLDLDRLQHLNQGFELQAKYTLKYLSSWQSRAPAIKVILDELFEPASASTGRLALQAGWPETDSDRLSALFDDEDEDAGEPFDECPDSLRLDASPLAFFSAPNCQVFLRESPFASAPGSAFRPNSAARPEPKAGPRKPTNYAHPAGFVTALSEPGTSQAAAVGQKDDTSFLVSVEDRMIELLAKLESFGCAIDSGFFESVYTKIDPATEDSEFLRAGLKILKTKIRKLRRKEKRRRTKKAARAEPLPESSEDGDSDEPGAEAVPARRLAAEADRTKGVPESCLPKQQIKVVTHSASVPSRLLSSSPRGWVQFLMNLTPIDGSPPAAKRFLVSGPTRAAHVAAPPATGSPQSKLLQRNEHDKPWRELLRSLRGRKQQIPKGWPDSVPENLRLNRERSSYSRRLRHPLSAASPFYFSRNIISTSPLLRASCN